MGAKLGGGVILDRKRWRGQDQHGAKAVRGGKGSAAGHLHREREEEAEGEGRLLRHGLVNHPAQR